MKLSTLKFREITSLINNKDLTLDLFQPHPLFQQDPKGSTPRNRSKDLDDFGRLSRPKSRPMTSRERAIYHNFGYTSPMNKKGHRPVEDCFFYLQKSLIEYIELISTEERKCIRKEMQSLMSLLSSYELQQLLSRLQQLQGVLSKRFSNRLLHLAFYLVFNKVSSFGRQRNMEREIKHYIFCQYYGRKFNFKQLTLAICIEIQSMYCALKRYEESRFYARKCLRLSVILDNEYYESKMIQSLAMLNFYEGRLNEESKGLLSKEERKRIIETYSEEKELPNIFNCEEVRDGEAQFRQFRQFSVQRHNNFIENSVPNQNVKYFQSNYHEIVKTIPKKSINVRGIISKVSEVGLVKKYFGKDNYITIRPECHIIRPINQEQVLITHKRHPKLAQKYQQSMQKAIKRLIALFQDTIACYTYRL